MANAYDTTAILAEIRRMARCPAATAPGWADADLLAEVNNEYLTHLVPELMKLRKDFLVTSADTSLVAGTASYAIPSRAALQKVREVQLLDGTGAHLDLAERGVEALAGRDTTSNNGTPEFYYWQDNKLVLVPAPDAATYTTLRIWYVRRPNRVVAVSAVLTVTGVGSAPQYDGTKPSGITTSTPCDFLQGTSPWVSRSDSITPSAAAAGSVTFSAAVTGAAVGDYVCLAGEAPVLQLPEEFFPILCQRVANELLRNGTDLEALKAGEAKLERMEKTVLGALHEDRNQGEVEAVICTVW